MSTRRDDGYRLRRIVEIGELLASVIETDGITRESILGDFHTKWLTMGELALIEDVEIVAARRGVVL